MGRRHYWGIFCLSLATLLLELALTRVLAVANWYHFGFLVISMALLGFGTSGVVLTLWTWLRERASMDHALAALSIGFGVVAFVSYWLMQQIPFDPFELLTDHKQLLFMPLYYVVVAAPFFGSGLAIGLLLFRGRDRVDRLYAADLLGAGVGCAAIAVVMPLFGGSGSIVVAAAFGFLAASVFGFTEARGLAVAGAVLAIIAVPFALAANRLIPISVTLAKHHPLQPKNRAPLYTAWNTFSRIDVYGLPAAPENGWPDAGFSIMIDGGAAGTGIGDLSGGARNYLTRPDYRPTGIAYVGKMHPKVLILGSGSGREVLEALDFDAQSITAVEINPIINDIVTRQMRAQWGGLFDQPEVKLVTDEGRNFLRRSKEKYDVIISIQTMTAAAVTSGAMALSESYMFTREAFADYLDHLTPDGVILVTRGLDQIVKLFATAREVFEERNLGNPATHLLAFEGPLAPYGHQLFNEGLLFKKSPFTADELQMVMTRLGVGHPERWYGRSPQIYYSPLGAPGPVIGMIGKFWSPILGEVLAAPSLSVFYAAHREEFRPATDDRPFFNQILRWGGLRPVDFYHIFHSGVSGSPVVQPVTEVMLIVMLIQSGAIASILIIFPLHRLAQHGLQISRPWTFLVYFAGLGLGFIMIEIVLIQRFLLFLGEPVYTFAVVLAGLLGFTGVGSWVVGRFREDARLSLMWIIPAILLVLLLTAIGSPWILTSALGLPLPLRIAIVVAMLAPLGLVLGMPFPSGLRIVAIEAPTFVPWAWGVNGFFTVVGSIGASILGMAFGFTAVLAISGACYLTALLAVMLAPAAPVTGERMVQGGQSGSLVRETIP
jgi:hypothetical protein